MPPSLQGWAQQGTREGAFLKTDMNAGFFFFCVVVDKRDFEQEVAGRRLCCYGD